MIGKILFASGGEELEATLNDDGRWTCSDSFYERALNIAFNCDDYSPAHGIFGWLQLEEAAKRFEGRVVGKGDPGPSHPGRLY